MVLYCLRPVHRENYFGKNKVESWKLWKQVIIVYGTGDNDEGVVKDQTDSKLETLLEKCKQIGILLNRLREKIKVCKTEIPFLGHLVTNAGLQADPAKVEAVQRIPESNSIEGA